MAGEYQFSLVDVTKQQGTKTILKDVNLSFFYGAHIGVIGANGAGKSSLLKILAGLDKELIGTVQVAKGTKVGYLPQEPELDDSKTVLETVMEGVKDAQDIWDNNLWHRRPCLVTIGNRTFACSLMGMPHNPDGDTIDNNNMIGQICMHFTNSKGHDSGKVDSYHQQAIQEAYEWARQRYGAR